MTIREWGRHESVAFICTQSGQNDKTAANLIADALGDLPLALEQAIAYIDDQLISLSTYLKGFNTRRIELWHEEEKPSDYSDTIATTWSMNINKSILEAPLASQIIEFCSFLAPEEIPRMIFSDHPEVQKGLKLLQRYSLIHLTFESLSIHRLVQAVIRDKMNEKEKQNRIKEVLISVLSHFPSNAYSFTGSWPICKFLFPHAQVILSHAVNKNLVPIEASQLANNVGQYLKGIFIEDEAETYLRMALELRKKSLNENDQYIAVSLSHLAQLLQLRGKYSEAEKMSYEALSITKLNFGESDPECATYLGNLPIVLTRQGKYLEAEEIARKALKILEANFKDSRQPSIAHGLDHLAYVLYHQNKYYEAEEWGRKAIEIWENLTNRRSRHLASCLHGLSAALQAQGKNTLALKNLNRAFKIAKEHLGENHKSTINIRDNLESGIITLYEPKSKND